MRFVWSSGDRLRLCTRFRTGVQCNQSREIGKLDGVCVCTSSGPILSSGSLIFRSMMSSLDFLWWIWRICLSSLIWVSIQVYVNSFCLCKVVGYNPNESLSQWKWLATRRESNVYFGSAIGAIYIAHPRDVLRDGSWSGIQLADQLWPKDAVYWCCFWYGGWFMSMRAWVVWDRVVKLAKSLSLFKVENRV